MKALSVVSAIAPAAVAVVLSTSDASALPQSDDGSALDAAEPTPMADEPDLFESGAPIPLVSLAPRGPEPLRASAEFGVLARNFRYNHPVADVFGVRLQPHQRALPIAGASVEWYPAAHWSFPERLWAHAALRVDFAHSLMGETPIGTEPFDTTFSDLTLGLRARIPLDRNELGLQFGWGQQSLTINGDNEQVFFDGAFTADPGIVPDIAYTYLRFGVDGAVLLSPLTLGAKAFMRLPTLGNGAGELRESHWFPKATATGWEVGASASLPVASMLSVFLAADVQVYGISMNTETTSAVQNGVLTESVAGGAADVYARLTLGASFNLPAPY